MVLLSSLPLSWKSTVMILVSLTLRRLYGSGDDDVGAVWQEAGPAQNYGRGLLTIVASIMSRGTRPRDGLSPVSRSYAARCSSVLKALTTT